MPACSACIGGLLPRAQNRGGMIPGLECRAAAVVLLLALLAAACGNARAADVSTGLIAGTVSDVGGTAIAGAAVDAVAPSGRYATVTDRRGRFAVLGVVPDDYTISAAVRGYVTGVRGGVRVVAGGEARVAFRLAPERTIGSVRASSSAFTIGSTSDTFDVSGDAARARAPAVSSAGLGAYAAGTVQGAIASVPGVDLDPFGNAILRGGKTNDAAFEYDGVPIPQGLIAEPGGNVAGAQLPTTGVATTIVTLAGYRNEADNALGGVIDQIPAIGTAPGRTTLDLAGGLGTPLQSIDLDWLSATPDLRWRSAIAFSAGAQRFAYGDGASFYPAEAGTYGLGLQNRSDVSFEGNVHERASDHDDLSLLALVGAAAYDQYGSPYAGQTVGAFDGAATVYPGSTDPAAPVRYAAGIRGTLDAIVAEWQHTGTNRFSRLRAYESRYGSSAGGPFWDDNAFPDGAISLSETSWQRQYGLTFEGEAVLGDHRVDAGVTARTDTSYLAQVVPTADETIASHPTVLSALVYLGDTWHATARLDVSATARASFAHAKPSDGFAYGTSSLDPHAAFAYRFTSQLALRADYDRITQPAAPLEIDRTDSANVDAHGNLAPFVPLAPETANDFTFALEGGGRTRFRLTYYAQLERNLIDVLPYDFRSAVNAGLSPSGVGVPTNVGDLRSHGVEFYVQRGGFTLDANAARAFSSSASQFAYNDLNAPAVAAGALFPVSYQPDFSATLSYAFALAHKRLRVTPSLAYATGYPYGNGTMVWVFGADGKPVQVPNDNHVDPGANYYFLQNPALPYDPRTNPVIGSLGTPEGSEPNTLRSTPQTFVNLHLEGDLTPRLTLVLDVANLLGNASPTAYQSNPYLIGPPGYTGGNAAYAACYGQVLAGTRPCAPGLPPGTAPYVLGNGVPTNDGVAPSLPWSYGPGGYVPQSYPLARTVQLRLRYRW